MKSSTLATSAALVLGLACLGSAKVRADVVYTYTGNDFTTASSPYTTSDSVTGSFVLSQPLGDNLNNSNINSLVLSFSFSDGVQTLTNKTFEVGPTFIDFSTNATGAITSWLISITAPGSFVGINTQNQPSMSFAKDEGSISETAFGSVNSAGSWSARTVTTPLPATLPLFAGGLGVLGLLGWRRKRKAQAVG